MTEQNAIILFDGFCKLCNGTVDFLIKKDHKRQFRFIPLQSEIGKRLIRKFKIQLDIDSVILIRFNKVFLESDAAIEIAEMLNYPWKLGVITKFIPAKIRNKLYQWIARNRYRWFGKREVCRIPTSEERELFNV